MKRCLAVVVTVLLLAGMTMPCFAGVVEAPERYDHFIAMIEKIKAKYAISDEYLVFANSTAPDSSIYLFDIGTHGSYIRWDSEPSLFIYYFADFQSVSEASISLMLSYFQADSVYKRINWIGKYSGNSSVVTYASLYWVADLSTAECPDAESFYMYTDVYHVTDISTLIETLREMVNDVATYTELDYTPSSWAALQSAVTDAQALLDSYTYTQLTVQGMIDRLQSAMNALEVVPDATELRELLARLEGYDESEYTPSTWATLQKAMSDAKALLQTDSYTAAQVQLMTTRLTNAERGLSKPTPPPEGTVQPSMFDSFLGVFRQFLGILIPICILVFGMIWGISMLPGLIKKLIRG